MTTTASLNAARTSESGGAETRGVAARRAGDFGWVVGVDRTGPVISFLPIILMGVVFGLAMDYEVFLVSRMREDYVHRGDARQAVRTGFLASGKVVTAAAVIMVAVFASFIPEGSIYIKPIALGLASGVFIDAFVVRMTLVPAVLQLLGDRAWHFPRFLERVLRVRGSVGHASYAPPEAFAAALDDDLGVPQALAVLHDTVRAGNAALDAGERDAARQAFTAVSVMTGILGVNPLDPRWLPAGGGAEASALDTLVRTMIDQRAAARADKDWAAADRIRDAIAAAGIALEDDPDGTHWSVQHG